MNINLTVKELANLWRWILLSIMFVECANVLTFFWFRSNARTNWL